MNWLRTFRQRLCVLSLPVLLGPLMAAAQPTETFRSWNQPVVPFRIIGNVYYVGASDVTSFLITTPAGHILLDGGFAETAPLIEKNIRELGFKLEDVKILLNSHAHFDHAGGLAELKRLTGARLIVSEPEAEMLARGGRGDFHYGDQLPFPPVKADQIIGDKGEIQLGGVVMTAHLTPGHTKGCTTWTMKATEADKSLDVVFMGSISIPGYRLTNNTNYPNIAADYAHSFKILKALPCDVFLAPHGFVFSLKEKMAGKGRKTNPFIDPRGYRKAIENAEHDYENQLNLRYAQLLNAPPAQPDPSAKFVFYLHGVIVEGSDGRPVSPDYGPYEYQKIIERFANDGFTVISEIRPANTDPALYGKKVASWVDQLIKAGVPARNISVVGASKGGVIAAHVSTLLRQPDLRFVILAGFFRNLESERNLSLHGRVLSIHDASDVFAIAPDEYFERSPDLSEGKSLVTQTGLGHGLVFQPHPAWYAPTVAWISRDLNEKRKVGGDEYYKFHFVSSDYQGDYLGLTRPGTTPERFAPGFISLDGRQDHGLVFAPSGKQAVFMTASLDWKDNRLCYLRQIEGRWTNPVELDFSRKNWCLNPIFTADEKRLIFSKVIGKDQTKYYYCDLTSEGYSAPHLLNTPLNDFTSGFSYYSDQRGNVYFCAVRPGGCGGTDLYVLAPGSGNDSITPITELNSPLDDDSPFLSPDGKYLVFNRQTKDPQGKVRHDVMFSYRTPSGQWAPPVNYGRHIGAPGRNWRPVITADGKYLFFGMEGEKGFDVYWVSNRVIEQLKPPQ